MERALEDLAERCPTFAAINYYLDCERVPCALGLPREEVLKQGRSAMEILCFDDMIDGVETLTRYGSATLLPLHTLPVERSGVDLFQGWEASKNVRWKELATFPGFIEGDDPRVPGHPSFGKGTVHPEPATTEDP